MKTTSNEFYVKFSDFNLGQAPLAHLNTLTSLGKTGHYSSASNVDVISSPEILTQGMGLATLTAGTEAAAITDLVNYIMDIAVAADVTYAISSTKLHKISSTAVSVASPFNVSGGGYTITNATDGSSVALLKGKLYYFFNKSSGADCGMYDLNVTFDDDYFSTVPTGAAALQKAVHPVATQQDLMAFGNGRYLGIFNDTTTTLSPTKLDFGNDAVVADVIFHANQWWVAVNSGITGTNRTMGRIYLYDGSAISAIIADETAVGVQRIGFIYALNGVVYVAYQDLSSSGGFHVGYISGRQLKHLRSFTGSLPTFAQKSLFNNTIIFVSSGLIYSCGAVIDQLPVQISQLMDGGFTTVGAIACPFGTILTASTQSTSFKLAKASGYDTACNYRTLVIPLSNGRHVGYIEHIIVTTKSLGVSSRCDLVVEINQAAYSGTVQQIIPKSATFTAAVTDIITSAGHGLLNGTTVILTTTTTLPAGLSLSTTYYVISATADTFSLSATLGGSAINITDTGTGTHTWWSAKRRHIFTNFGLPAGGVEDFRLFLSWANGSATNDCPIRQIEVIGTWKEK